jgi:YesN/AraC family two-component response regulator
MAARILIVDDEQNLAHTLGQTLQLDFPDAEIDAAYSGEEGLSRLAEASYDLLIADLRMPGFSGLDLIKGVRYLDQTVPIILITGYGSPGLREECAQLGVNDYLDKPLDTADLISSVRRCLAERGSADA